MVVAAVAFLFSIGLGIRARRVGRIRLMGPETLYDQWIKYTEKDFKRYFIYFAGKHHKKNASLLEQRYRLLQGAIVFFVVEVLLFGAAVVSLHPATP